MALNYRRIVYAQIGVPGDTFRQWRGLRIAARIKKTRNATANTCECEIYNVNEDSIAVAQRDKAVIRLFAGYNSTPRLVFQGEINRKNGAILKNQSVDRILKIEAKDGGRLRGARVVRSFSRDVSVHELVRLAADALAIPIASLSGPDATLVGGVNLQTDAQELLDTLAASTGAEASIQDGALQWLAPSEGRVAQALLVSSRAGNLVGSPAPTNDGLKVTALLDGRYLPGGLIRLQSRDYNGVFKIRNMEHVLDSGWDSTYTSELICKAM